MTHPDLGAILQTSLPVGYRTRFYAEGDLATWLRIQAHDPFFVPTAETFATWMPGDTALLATRLMFLVDPRGEAIGTVTAWSTDRLHYVGLGFVPFVRKETERRAWRAVAPRLRCHLHIPS